MTVKMNVTDRFKLTQMLQDVIADGPSKMTAAQFASAASKALGRDVSVSQLDTSLKVFGKTRSDVFDKDAVRGSSVFAEIKSLKDRCESLEDQVKFLNAQLLNAEDVIRKGESI